MKFFSSILVSIGLIGFGALSSAVASSGLATTFPDFEVKCKSVADPAIEAHVTLDSDGHLKKVEVPAVVDWSFNAADDAVAATSAPERFFNDDFPAVNAMKNQLQLPKVKMTSHLSISTSATARVRSMEEQIEVLGDGAGIALLTFFDTSGKLLNGNLVVGWAGSFTPCESVATP